MRGRGGVTCPVCGGLSIPPLRPSLADARCRDCNAAVRRVMPFAADLRLGIVLPALGVAAVVASFATQRFLPVIAWLVVLYAADHLAPLRPDLDDPETRREVERRDAA